MYPVFVLLLAVTIVLVSILVLRLHAFLALLLAALAVALLTPTTALEAYAEAEVESGNWTAKVAADFVESTAASRIADGFGSTCASIGILIAMAAIIGRCLLDSGSADRIVRAAVGTVGESRAPVALVGSSFLLGIPVFFDTVFYLMIPLGKALRQRTGKHYVLYILSIVAGGSMAHSLVPPTPGPLYVADKMGVDLLTMIVAGCGVGLCSATAAYIFASWLDRRMEIPLREEPGESLDQPPERPIPPPLWLALLPIMLPVLLIAADTAFSTWQKSVPGGLSESAEWFGRTVHAAGNKNIALMAATAVALLTLAQVRRQSGYSVLQAVSQALASGGVIILITAAGGAFGTAVRQLGIAAVIGSVSSQVPALALLPLAFLITTLIRTAQGSATVAMITAVGVLQPLAEQIDLPYHAVYLALAIGCGSKPIAWMADSGFWVICKMSGMTEAEGLKTVTPTSIVMGLSGITVTILAAALLPLK